MGNEDRQIANPIGDVAQNLFHAAEDLRYRLRSLPNKAANKLVDGDRGLLARQLTDRERQAIIEAFGYEVDLNDVRIVNGPGLSPMAHWAFKLGGNPAITIGDTIFVRHNLYVADLTLKPDQFDRLLHEFTHVVQYRRLGFGTLLGRYTRNHLRHPLNRNATYDYETRKTTFDQETIEGQAEMVGNYARLRKFGGAEVRPKVEDIERRLKGTNIYGL